jgi:uncharacterized protein YdeI (YjbR/CyaY-like superfamily)
MARSFRTQEAFRTWLEKNHGRANELILRCFKTHAKHRGLGYKGALDEALCFGWIDGVRRALDDDSFAVRFTPRRERSNWSKVNVERATKLKANGRMHAAGLAAFRSRAATAPAPYSFESKSITLDRGLEKKLRANKRAWQYFQAQPPWYRRTVIFWIMTAKRDATRAKRLAKLIERSAQGAPIPPLARAQ